MALSLIDRSTLDELGAVIGSEKLARLVDRFTANLATAFEGCEPTADGYAREAHTLISMSGMLGCEPLSRACRDLEQSVKTETDLSACLHDVLSLRDRTVAALRALSAEADAGLGPPKRGYSARTSGSERHPQVETAGHEAAGTGRQR